MDFKRLTAFFAIALVIMIGWEKMFPTPKPVPAPQQAAQNRQQPLPPKPRSRPQRRLP